MSKFTDIGVEKTGHVSTIEIRRPPLNFFDIPLINQIADALTDIDNDPEIRAVVLAAQGKAFCAGANFAEPANMVVDTPPAPGEPPRMGEISPLYIQAVRIFRNKKPIVAAVHGAAIGGGLGLALSADFRVTCPEARFSANFTKLGFHPGFATGFIMAHHHFSRGLRDGDQGLKARGKRCVHVKNSLRPQTMLRGR